MLEKNTLIFAAALAVIVYLIYKQWQRDGRI